MTTKTTAKKKTTTKIVELPPHPFAFEVFDLVSKQRSAAKKVEVLQKYNHPSLRALLIWNFDESVKSMLPDGPVPYGRIEDQTAYKGGSFSDKIGNEVRDMYEKGSMSVQDEQQNVILRTATADEALTWSVNYYSYTSPLIATSPG